MPEKRVVVRRENILYEVTGRGRLRMKKVAEEMCSASKTIEKRPE